MRVELCAGSLNQDGRPGRVNEDAYLILRQPVPVAAVCDGSGHAEQAAKKVLRQFELYIRQSTPEQLLSVHTWFHWVKSLDSFLLGGNESTFLGVAVVENQLMGACAGDSHAFLLGAEGRFHFLTAPAGKKRLGSGEVEPFIFKHLLNKGDIVLLMTDGAWTPFDSNLNRILLVARQAAVVDFTEVPAAVLKVAGHRGRWDDMTVVALRLTRR